MPTSGAHRPLPTLVSAKARLRLSFGDVVRRDRSFAIDAASRTIVLVAGLALRYPPLILAGAVMSLGLLRRFRRLRVLFAEGEPAPAKLLRGDPPLAVAALELSRTPAQTLPALVVFRPLASPAARQPGDRLVAVAKGASGDEETWSRVSVCLASDFADEARVRPLEASIGEWQWDELEEALFSLPMPYAPGTYPLVEPGSPSKSR